ncbi:glycosyltransferase family 1 protein [Microbacterium kribbense]|uniref:Glycosyltransferase family 1 protein n=1 Tax=Microbacterium kribbense TaxID=433645 RepID=A0ABP7FZI6_9MICO
MSFSIAFATSATSTPMGQQVYEEELIARAQTVLGPTAKVTRTIARSLRSELPGTVRLPAWLTARAPTSIRRMAGAALYRGADVVHRMGLGMPPAHVPEVITVHDTIAWRFDDESRPEPFVAAELRRAAAVITPSQSSADDIAELFAPPHVQVIPNGVDIRFYDAPALPDASLRGLGITGPFVLHMGGASRRKNLEGLAEAWKTISHARPDVSLVLCGPDHPRRTDLFARLPRTVLVGRLAADLIPGLAAAASVVVVPSLYEGFGLPALEAMAVGTPVVAARTSSLPEVIQDGGTLVDPTPDGIAEGVVWALTGDSVINQQVSRGRARAVKFTWERSAAAHAEVWRAAAAEGR